MTDVQSVVPGTDAKTGKPTSQQIETIYDDEKYPDEKAVNTDYSGATKKTDPAEIKLVKKLDYRIMPILWAMYFMNYVSFKMDRLNLVTEC